MALANYAPVTRRVTPQSQPIPGRTDQVKNNAGGYTFQLSAWDRLDRFLILGAEGGTFYVGEHDLVTDNHDNLVSLIKEDGVRVVNRIIEISVSGRAPKNDPALFALAMVLTHGDPDSRTAAGYALPKVARIGTHLFHFVHYASALRGWGRGLRNAVARWYELQDLNAMAYQVIKYQSRDSWSHRDLLRLAHPSPVEPGHQAVYRWIIGGKDSLKKREVTRKSGATKTYAAVGKYLPEVIESFERAKAATTAKEIVTEIVNHNLPRECIPTQFLNNVEVWDALLQKMPLTAMIRNLGKMTSIGLVGPLSAAASKITEALGSQDAIRKARVHPIQLLLALKVYEQGHGDKGSLKWNTVPQVSAALDSAFYLAFGNIVPTGKRILYALDVSGSMGGAHVAGTSLTAREVSAAMALVMASTEKNYHIMGFSNRFITLDIRPGMRLTDAIKKIDNLPFEATDCAQPMLWASQNKVDVDAFAVITDNETWAGEIHPTQALTRYRGGHVSDAKLVVLGTTATGFTINDPNDRYGLDVVGFDAAVPNLVSDFIRGFETAKDSSKPRVASRTPRKTRK